MHSSSCYKWHLALLVLCFVLSCSCQNKRTSQGIQASTALRIVSLAPSVSKELCYLGAEKNIVGATSYCNISKGNEDLIIGSAIDVNIEKIVLLKPSIVIATGLTKQNNIEALRNNGVKVHLMSEMHSFKDICNAFITLGKIVNKEQKARTIIGKAQHTIDSLRTSISGERKKKVFFQIGAKPIYAVISNTFLDELITLANGENIACDMTYGTMTRESVINSNPDVIYVANMGIVGQGEKKIWESYNTLNAVRDNKVFIIDSGMACTPSVIAFTQTLNQMIKEIYHNE